MSIQILFDLHLEVRRLFIAGSRMAAGDLRLTKMLPSLQKLGESAPVFQRVAQSLKAVIEPEDSGEDSAAKLLDLSTLLYSILYTQGTTEVSGDSVRVEGSDNNLPSNLPYRKLSPVMEAFTSKGQGRMERIQQAYEDKLLSDIRVMPSAIAALDDGYSEIADYVSKKIIPIYGEAALPVLLKQFDMQGGKAHGRRLAHIHELQGEAGKPLYLEAAETGSVEVRAAAIELLGNYPEQEDLLLVQADEKKKEIRAAALTALAKLNTSRAANRLYQALTTARDREIAVDAIQHSQSVTLTRLVMENAEEMLERIVNDSDKAEAIKQLLADIECLDGKKQPEVRELLQKLLSSPGLMIAEADAIQEKTAQLLLWMRSPEADSFLIELQPLYQGRFIRYSFDAAYRNLSPEAIYERFSPVLREKKKSEAKNLLLGALNRVTPSWSRMGGLITDADGEIEPSEDSQHRLDDRWIHLFVEMDQEELVWPLADKPDKKIASYLIGKLQTKPQFGSYRTLAALLALFRIGHSEAPELLMQVMENGATRSLYYLNEEQRTMIYLLPRSYADRLKAFAQTLSYERVKEQVLEMAEQIAEKPEEAAAEKGTGLWGWIRSKMS